MNAQSAKSFLLCFAKDILQRKSVLLDIFQLILITTSFHKKISMLALESWTQYALCLLNFRFLGLSSLQDDSLASSSRTKKSKIFRRTGSES